MTVGSFVYIFIWWIILYTLYWLFLLSVASSVQGFRAIGIYIVLLISSYHVFHFLQFFLPDGFHVVSMWLIAHAPMLTLYILYAIGSRFIKWLDSDPIVAGVNIRKSIDRKQ